jgi:hypothetical protein
MAKNLEVPGKVHTGAKEYVVWCGQGCREFFVDHLYSQRSFLQSLRAAGWKLRKGLWTCPNHDGEHNVQPTESGGWACQKCETINRDGAPDCSFCDTPRFGG